MACGALSGFHSLVSTNTSSKQVSNEKDMVVVGYGAMVAESFVGVLAIVFAAILFGSFYTFEAGAPTATPFQIFSQGVANGMTAFGVDADARQGIHGRCASSALALTSVDAVARIGRLSFQEFFAKTNDAAEEAGAGPPAWAKVASNTWVATVLTLALGLALASAATTTSGRSSARPTSCSAA